jgi:UDP-N-acetylmuramyl-tripeptide synthetase
MVKTQKTLVIQPSHLKMMKALTYSANVPGLVVSGIATDSRLVQPGDAFVAVRGRNTDGHQFIGDAVSRKASLVVCENVQGDIGIPYIIVEDSRVALAALASLFFKEPTKRLSLIGVTGTDGKTTTSMLIETLLNGAGLKTGLLGTVTYRFLGSEIPAPLTTPDALTLQKMFCEMVENGVTAAVMEVSSHALDQRRTDFCHFDVGVFTLLARDHLDYHKTLEAYKKAKLRLFTELLPQSCKAKGVVANGQDPVTEEIIRQCPLPVFTFASNGRNAHIFPVASDFTLNGLSAVLVTPWGEFDVRSKLIGAHNLQNIMAAIGACGVLGIDLKKAVPALSSVVRIPGRLERVQGRRPIHVFVDYAHTPKAIENCLKIVRSLASSEQKIIIVFGAGGDRDKGKRPLMGKAAIENADFVVVTSDNPRSEDPLAIIEEILGGIRETNKGSFIVEPDRRLAIKKALDLAKDGDIVIIAGKGHEKYQIVKDKKLPFDDCEVAREFMS